jgi:hypothetical protein
VAGGTLEQMPTLVRDPQPAEFEELPMEESEDNGYETLEEAARGDIPPEFGTVVGSRVDGDVAMVWLLTNDRPPFEAHEVYCKRKNGRWHWDSGYGGFGGGTPDEVLAQAHRLGWS